MSDHAIWMENNDKHLAATVAWIRQRLEQLAQPDSESSDARKTGRWFKRSSTLR